MFSGHGVAGQTPTDPATTTAAGTSTGTPAGTATATTGGFSGGPGSGAPTTTAVATTAPPPSTTAPPFNAAVLTSNELDVRLDFWSDELVVSYRKLFSDLAGIPIVRVTAVPYGNSLALEFGREYIATIRIEDRTNATTDVLEPADAAELLERECQALIGARDARFVQRTIKSVARVAPEKRVSEKGSLGVNYVWVAFLLLAVAMLGVSAIVLMRRRSSSDDDDIGAEIDEEKPKVYPKDLQSQNVDSLLRLVDRAEAARLQREQQDRQNAIYAPRTQLFQAALDNDYRLQLPPPSTVPDPLAPRPVAPGSIGGDDASKDTTTAKPALSKEAQAAIEALHAEMDGSPAHSGTPADAAPSPTPPPRRKGPTLREEYERARLMDLNDADL